jgi:cytochrome P450
MSGASRPQLDRARVRELFDLRKHAGSYSGGDYNDDPYPVWDELRSSAPVHEGIVHKLTGYPGDAMFQGLPYPDRPHFSAFTWDACDQAFRDNVIFASSPNVSGPDLSAIHYESSMLSMGGVQHFRYRSLVQPSFVPAKAQWWINNWIQQTVHELIDAFQDDGRAELNIDFCAAIPVLTITSSFGVPIEQALDVREAVANPASLIGILAPIVAARREDPQDDLITVLCEAELKDDEGTHRLSDEEIYTFAILLLMAGSGTTWKQMGITLAALLDRPEVLAAVRDDRSLLKGAIEESLRWMPTDPMFSRWVTDDIDFHGVHVPKGSVMHLCVGAANRDPARWERPHEYDIHRPIKPSVAFGRGPHVCLGMHVARAEMSVGISALLDRLPNLRLDPDAERPRPVGFYERGVMEIPVVFG